MIDVEALASAKNILKGNFQETLQIFLTNAQERILEMQTAVKDRKWEDAVRAAHTLKSSAAQMGAASLSQHAMEIEKRLRDDLKSGRTIQQQKISDKIGRITEVAVQTNAALREAAGDTGAGDRSASRHA